MTKVDICFNCSNSMRLLGVYCSWYPVAREGLYNSISAVRRENIFRILFSFLKICWPKHYIKAVIPKMGVHVPLNYTKFCTIFLSGVDNLRIFFQTQ